MRKLSVLVLTLFLCAGLSFAAGNKNSGNSGSSNSQAGSFGIGYSKATFDTGALAGTIGIDEVSGRFWFADDFGVDVRFGFGTGDVNTRILIDSSIIGNIVKVNKLNIYWLAGLTFGAYTLKNTNAGDVDCSVLGIHGGIGAEYYVLPCLSVLTEMGIRYISVKPDNFDSRNDFGVYADWLPQAGIRYYFQ